MKEGKTGGLEMLETSDDTTVFVTSVEKLSSDIDCISNLVETISKLIESDKEILTALGGSMVFSLKIGDLVDITTVLGKVSDVTSNLEMLAKQIEGKE